MIKLVRRGGNIVESIHESLQKWISENKDFQQKHEDLTNEVLSHPSVAALREKYPELTDKQLHKQLITLYEYQQQSILCADCPSYEECINVLKGYSPILEMHNDRIHVAYEECPQKIAHDQRRKQNELIKRLHMPQDIMNATFDRLEKDVGRREAIKSTVHFIQSLKEGLPSKGIFFSGKFGVGKTYFLGVLANELQEYNYSSMLIYMPEFVRSIRDAINDNTVNEKVHAIKEIDVLMFDDIGAETMSAWFRDEILGSILQYRMIEQLPVFFTSNYTMRQLEEQLSTSTRGDVEEIKAQRIMERIRQTSEEVLITGANRRYR